MQVRLRHDRQLCETLQQRGAGERVHAQPIAVFARDQQRRVARQPGKALAGVGHAGHRAAQVGMQVVGDGDAGQELRVAAFQVDEQRIDEVIVQRARARR